MKIIFKKKKRKHKYKKEKINTKNTLKVNKW